MYKGILYPIPLYFFKKFFNFNKKNLYLIRVTKEFIVYNINGLQFQKLTRISLSSFISSLLLILMILTIPLLNNVIASKDIFGIEKIYSTKKGGEEWYIDMINPLSDNRFDPYNLLAMEDRKFQDPPLFKIIRNKDNSLKMVPLSPAAAERSFIVE